MRGLTEKQKSDQRLVGKQVINGYLKDLDREDLTEEGRKILEDHLREAVDIYIKHSREYQEEAE